MAAVSVAGGVGGATGDQGSDAFAVAFQQMAQGLAGIQEAVRQQERRMQEAMRQQETRMLETIRQQGRSMQELLQQQEARMQELLRQQEIRVQESLQQWENRVQEVMRQKIEEMMSQHDAQAAVRQEEMMQLEGNTRTFGALTERLQRVDEGSAVGECQFPSPGVGERVGGRAALGHLEGRMTTLEAAVQRALETVFPRVEALVAQLEKPSPPAAAPASTSISTSAQTSPSAACASISSSPPRRRRRVVSPSTSSGSLSPGSYESDWDLPGAAAAGEVEDVRRLLDAGASVNGNRASGTTPLMEGARNEDVVELLLQRGADINARNEYGTTALHFAASAIQSGRCVTRLIEAGALVDCRDECGQTPLHCAASEACLNAARALLEAGASTNLTDSEGQTPYDIVPILLTELRRLLRPRE